MPERAADGGADPVEDQLRAALTAASSGASRLMVLLGDSRLADRSVGAVLDGLDGLDEPWHVWAPRGPHDLAGGLRGGPDGAIAPWTVVRLDGLARFLLPPERDLALTVASALRGALVDARSRPLLVVATLDPDPAAWSRLTRPFASGGPAADVQAQALMRTAVVLVVSATSRPGDPPDHPPAPAPLPAPAEARRAVPPGVPTRQERVTAEPATAEPVLIEPVLVEPVRQVPADVVPEGFAVPPAADVDAAGGDDPDVLGIE